MFKIYIKNENGENEGYPSQKIKRRVAKYFLYIPML